MQWLAGVQSPDFLTAPRLQATLEPWLDPVTHLQHRGEELGHAERGALHRVDHVLHAGRSFQKPARAAASSSLMDVRLF